PRAAADDRHRRAARVEPVAPRDTGGDLLPRPDRSGGGGGARPAAGHRQVPRVLRAARPADGAAAAGGDRMMQEQHFDVAAYALGVLDERDAARFEDHLIDCATCAIELESMLPVVDILSDV